MRGQASILHLDLDAFFAAVEQRDKPSLRGKPVVVGGTGQRGVVATASYEARVFGVRSAMPSHEARRRCPNAAFLSGRFPVYREASGRVMAVLRELSPVIEPLSLDEAFVDLARADRVIDFTEAGLRSLVVELKRAVTEATDGLTASIGIGSSKLIAKIASEINKPDGAFIAMPGTEVELLRPMRVEVIPGVGPVTKEKLHRIGIHTVADLQQVEVDELVQVVGRAQGEGLAALAFARDDRPVEPEREAKSISVEDTFEFDLVDPRVLGEVTEAHARQVARRLRAAALFARTITIKVRLHDFTTCTRSRTLLGATDRAEIIADIARTLLAGVDTRGGVRLLGVGVAGLTDLLQEDLFAADVTELETGEADVTDRVAPTAVSRPDPAASTNWPPGADVDHDEHGAGWVWGAGRGRVTVRFEARDTPPGPVRTFRMDDPALHRRAAVGPPEPDEVPGSAVVGPSTSSGHGTDRPPENA
ncbi:DNA polymerase IV [Microlunatus panaciterrae]|uniref:DNA polymerase IV n=1 Tax=Microlunatus panaciterrae TaxID=400768 RepID=A0ABS2RLN4_9ACTN|nr:DNA polymerase-4 [Microlunatus panaciterrae]